jgi:putative Ca2+/H+ antiporter (TMEM165/GDT1 family)
VIEAFFASTAVVALAEIGDKTMLLAIVFAARLRAPWQCLPDHADRFFLVEMGDKTQVATIALGAQYHSVVGHHAGHDAGQHACGVSGQRAGQAGVAEGDADGGGASVPRVGYLATGNPPRVG